MITCRECIEGLKPDDPRIRAGRYNLCGCDYCSKPTYFRELEKSQRTPFIPRPIVNVTYKLNDVETPGFKSLQRQISQLKGRMIKYFDDKKKPTSYIYSNIIEETNK